MAIAKAADELERWIGANAGNSADWPIRIRGDDEGAEKISELLNSLVDALKPYRE